MKKAGKKAWIRPELLILIRGEAQDAILLACIYSGGAWKGPGDQCSGCWFDDCNFGCNSPRAA